MFQREPGLYRSQGQRRDDQETYNPRSEISAACFPLREITIINIQITEITCFIFHTVMGSSTLC